MLLYATCIGVLHDIIHMFNIFYKIHHHIIMLDTSHDNMHE